MSANIQVAGWKQLRRKEKHIVHWLAKGMQNKEIAEKVHVTEHRVKNYLRNVYDKLGFSNRVEVALWYIKQTCKPVEETSGEYHR